MEAEDFEVEELPAYAASGSGSHAFLWIQKKGISTLDAIKGLARALGRREKEFGYAGLKDAKAVARQWISIEHADEGALRGLAVPGLELLEFSYHENKLKLGHSKGNRFGILLRGVGAEHAAAARENLEQLAESGVPNYFGEQRFGKRGANLEKGLRILVDGNPKKAARTMPRRLLSLLISAVQSEVFNQVLARRIADFDRLVVGDIAWLHKNGACFAVENLEEEQRRCEAFEISPTGPLPGPKMLQAGGEVQALEEEVMASLGLESELFGRMPHGSHAGARRALRLQLLAPEVEVVKEGLYLRFELGPGSYATTVLRELLETSPWFSQGRV